MYEIEALDSEESSKKVNTFGEVLVLVTIVIENKLLFRISQNVPTSNAINKLRAKRVCSLPM